eukprot:gene12502-biopygen15504
MGCSIEGESPVRRVNCLSPRSWTARVAQFGSAEQNGRRVLLLANGGLAYMSMQAFTRVDSGLFGLSSIHPGRFGLFAVHSPLLSDSLLLSSPPLSDMLKFSGRVYRSTRMIFINDTEPRMYKAEARTQLRSTT